MAFLTRAPGTVSEILNVYFRDTRNVSTIGMPNISASSIAFSWCRNNQASQSSGTCTTNTVIGTYSTTALTQISSTSTLGWYQFGLPDGALVGGRSVVVHLWSRTSTAGVDRFSCEIDLLGSLQPVSVSTMLTPVGVSSASVDFGVSTIAVAQKLVGVSTMTTPVGVSSASVDFGVSTIAVAQKLVGVSTIAAGQKLVGVSTVSAEATSTIATGVWSTSTASDFETSSSIGFSLYGAFNIGTTVYTASSLANAPTGGGGSPVGVSSISVLVGVSTLATSVSSVTGSVNVSSATVDFGVSTIAVAQKLVGVSTIATSQKLVGVSTMTTPVGVSSASVNLGVSTLATSVSSVTGSVNVSSATVDFGVSTLTVPVGVSSIAVSVDVSSMNSAGVTGTGHPSDLWRGA